MSAKLVAGVRSLHLVVDPPVERYKASGVLEYRNDIVGIKVWCSTVSGFTPSSANLVFDGVGLDVLISSLTDLSTPQAGTTYYVKYALISEIDRTYITYSQEYSAVPLAAAGIQTDIVYLYKWANTLPTTNPTGTGTYTWANSTLAYVGSDGWSASVPTKNTAVGNILYEFYIQISGSSSDATYSITNWSSGSIREYSITGNVLQSTSLDLYQWTSATQPSISGNLYYRWSDGAVVNSNNQITNPTNWTLLPTVAYAGQTLWKASVPIIDSIGATATAINWTEASIYVAGYAGSNGISASLSNPAVTVQTDFLGAGGVYTNTGGTFTVLDGSTDVTNSCSFYLQSATTGLSISINAGTGVYTVTDLSVDSGNAVLRATYGSYIIYRNYSIAKSKAAATYDVKIESTNGTAFRLGQSTNTTLKAKVFLNDTEVTDQIDSGRFKWRRVSMIPQPSPNDDATWNALYIAGYKQITINVDDVYAKATFFCDIMST